MAFHRILPMTGRNPHEEHRVSTPLELLFDLTFVVAFGIAGNEMAHILAEGHFGTALAAYAFVMFGVCWAWINYSWFASAYATDDWLFRLLTMAQMVGVVIFALGLPDVFKSMDEGNILDNRVVVFGYMIMRLPVVALWLRAARHDAARRPTALTYVKTLLAAQALWTVIMIVDLPIAATFAAMSVPFAIELLGPYLAERKGGTPWHPHHIAERYGLLTIIALGEGVIGTVASVSAVVEEAGWNLDAILVASAGIGLTFALWWIYFVVPSGEFLHRHRERSFFWGYGHMPLFAAIAGMGAGLHVAALFIEGKSHIGPVATLLCVAVPVALYIVALFVIYWRLVRDIDPFHKSLIAVSALLLGLAVLSAWLGLPLAYSLFVLLAAPVAVVIGYEWKGHKHVEAQRVRLEQ